MSGMSADADPEKERQDKAQRQVSALHSEAKRLARLMADGGELKPAADTLLAIARQKADNAGLAKRHAAKVEARVSKSEGIEEWLNGGDDGQGT